MKIFLAKCFFNHDLPNFIWTTIRSSSSSQRAIAVVANRLVVTCQLVISLRSRPPNPNSAFRLASLIVIWCSFPIKHSKQHPQIVLLSNVRWSVSGQVQPASGLRTKDAEMPSIEQHLLAWNSNRE